MPMWPVNDAPEHYLRTAEDRSRWKAALAVLAGMDPQIAARRAYYETALDYHGEDQLSLKIYEATLTDTYMGIGGDVCIGRLQHSTRTLP